MNIAYICKNHKCMTYSVELAKKKKQEESILAFLDELYSLTKDGYVKLSLSDLVKKHKLASNLVQAVKSYRLLFSIRTGTGKTHKWNYFLKPNMEMATNINNIVREKQKEYNDKAYQKSKSTMSLGNLVINTPSTIKIKKKVYYKVLTKKPEPVSVIKPVPTTLSEIHMEQSLLSIKSGLSSVHVLDFNSFCLSRAISEKHQYALIECQCIAFNKGVGYEWVGGDVTLELIQKIIKTRHNYIGVMPDVPLMPKPVLTKDQKKLAVISKYLIFLRNLYTLTNGSEVKISLQNLLREYNIDNTFFMYVKEHNIIIKNKDNKPLYSWNKDFTVDIELAQQVYEWCFEKRKFYTNKAKDLINDTEKETIERIVEEKLSHPMSLTFGPDTKNYFVEKQGEARCHRIMDPISVTHSKCSATDTNIKLIKNSEKEMKSSLAEKFAKVGNYKMAEQLLNEILN